MANQESENEQSWFSRIVSLNPVLIRGVLVSVAGLLAVVFGKTVVDNETIETIIEVFVSVTALVTALWSRGKVIAENKVIAWNPDPLKDSTTIKPGIATIPRADLQSRELIEAAKTSATQSEVRKAA